jgi:microcin C transport system permease protein
MLKDGTANLHAPWILASAFGALAATLILVTFVGEAIREAYDPRKYTYYR